MDSVTSGLLGTAIGAASGILGGIITNRHQRVLEDKRWQQSRADELRKEMHALLHELVALLAEGIHSSTRLVRAAETNSSTTISSEMGEFTQQANELLPRIAVVRSLVAGANSDAHKILEPVANDLVTLVYQLLKATNDLQLEPRKTLLTIKQSREASENLSLQLAQIAPLAFAAEKPRP